MGQGIPRGRRGQKSFHKGRVNSMSPISKTRLLLGMIFSITGIVLIIIGLLGIKG